MQNHGKCSFSLAISYAEDDYIKKYIEKMQTGGFNNLVGHSRSVNLLLKIYFPMLKIYVFFLLPEPNCCPLYIQFPLPLMC